MLSEHIFARNVEALARRSPALAHALAAAQPRQDCQITPTPSGHFTARIASPGGATTLHSAYDPVREAARFVEAKGFGERDNYVLMGFGLGYVAEEILVRLGKRQQAVIVEADLPLLRTALSLRDLAPLLSSEKMHLFAGDDLADVSLFMAAFFDASFIEDITVIKHPPSLLLNPAFYAAAEVEVRNAANKRVVDLQTALSLGPKCQANIIANSVQYLENAGIDSARGAFAGKPAIVVAAGPSLDKNVRLLRGARERALVVCVGTALKKLLAAGARPHIVVSIDPDVLSYRYFEGLGDMSDVVLAADPELCPQILRDYPGPKLITGVETPTTAWLNGFAPPKGTLPKGRSVAHTAFYVARRLGADPIIFVGLDLCFPGGRAHAEGCNAAWGDELELEREQGLAFVRGIDGTMHPARKNFLNFLTIFENEFTRTEARIIDATEGGALKRGAEIMTLAEALDRFAAEPLDASPLLRAAAERPAIDRAAFADAAAGICAAADAVIAACRDALRLLKRLRTAIGESGAGSQQAKKLTRRVNECHERLFERPHIVPIIQRNMLETKIYFERRNVALISDLPFGDERALREIERGEVFFADTLRSASRLKPLLGGMRDAARQAAAGAGPTK